MDDAAANVLSRSGGNDRNVKCGMRSFAMELACLIILITPKEIYVSRIELGPQKPTNYISVFFRGGNIEAPVAWADAREYLIGKLIEVQQPGIANSVFNRKPSFVYERRLCLHHAS